MSNLAKNRQPTRHDLDPSFPHNPVILIHSSNHGCVLNSAAFKVFGIDASTKTPPGGVILRKPGSQEPEGLLMEMAFMPIFAQMPQPFEADMLAALEPAEQSYAGVGVTTCQDGAANAHHLDFMRNAAAQGLLYVDVVSLPLFLEVSKMAAEFSRLQTRELASAEGSRERLRNL